MGCAAAGSDIEDDHFHEHFSTGKCCNICISGPACSCSLDFAFLSPPDLPLVPLTIEVKAALSKEAGPHRSLWGTRLSDLMPLTLHRDSGPAPTIPLPVLPSAVEPMVSIMVTSVQAENHSKNLLTFSPEKLQNTGRD